MFYHLFQFLEKAGVDIPGSGLMHYISFRAMMASVTAVLVALFAGKGIIRWLQRKQIGETVRDLGLQGQIEKKGTPTMGGIIILLSILSGVLLFCDDSHSDVISRIRGAIIHKNEFYVIQGLPKQAPKASFHSLFPIDWNYC